MTRTDKSTGLAIAAAVIVAIVALLVRVSFPDTLRNFANLAFDSYQRTTPRAWSPDLPVRIVDIDEASLKKIGQWPWPRDRLANLTQSLHEAGAAAIVFDFLFAEADRTSPEQMVRSFADTPARRAFEQVLELTEPHDARFAKSLSDAPSVLAVALTPDGTAGIAAKAGYSFAGDDPTPFIRQYGGGTVPLPALMQAARGLGSINWIPDRDQVLRRVPLVLRTPDGFVPSLAAEALRVAQGASSYVLRGSNASRQSAFGTATGLNAIKIGAFEIPTDPEGAVVVRYTKRRTGSIPARLESIGRRGSIRKICAGGLY